MSMTPERETTKVTIRAITCIHCGQSIIVGSDATAAIKNMAEHDATCEQHPLQDKIRAQAAEIATLKAEVERLKRENRRRAACDLVNDRFKRSIEEHEEREGWLKDANATLRTKLTALREAGEGIVNEASTMEDRDGHEYEGRSELPTEMIDALASAVARAQEAPMSELKWEKTTFGELKEGDYFVTQPISKSGDFTSLCIAKHCKWSKDLEVYRLVSPEREALEKIRDMKRNDRDWDSVVWEMQRIATAALALLDGGGE